MAKASDSKKATHKQAIKRSPADNSLDDGNTMLPAADNNSKYQSTQNVDMNVKSLDSKDGLMKLFVDSVKDLYWAENHLVKALPKLITAASSKALQNAIANHLEETKKHVERLEQVFDAIGKKPQAKKCDAMEGLTKEAEGVIEDTDSDTPARNLGIIMAAQKTEHYEISAYSGVNKLAKMLGLNDVAKILSETLEEETAADNTLGSIADNDISIK